MLKPKINLNHDMCKVTEQPTTYVTCAYTQLLEDCVTCAVACFSHGFLSSNSGG